MDISPIVYIPVYTTGGTGAILKPAADGQYNHEQAFWFTSPSVLSFCLELAGEPMKENTWLRRAP